MTNLIAEERYLEDLTELILSEKEAEKDLARSIDKILNFIEEDEESPIIWEYNVAETDFSTNETGIMERMGFLSVYGNNGWELCCETGFFSSEYGNCTRYTFKRVKQGG